MDERHTTPDEHAEQLYARAVAMIDQEWLDAGATQEDLERGQQAARALAFSPAIVTALAGLTALQNLARRAVRVRGGAPTEHELLEQARRLIVDAEVAIETAYRDGIISNRHRFVLYLFYWHRFTLGEIAEALGSPLPTVEETLNQALRGLERTGLLESYGDPADVLGSFRPDPKAHGGPNAPP